MSSESHRTDLSRDRSVTPGTDQNRAQGAGGNKANNSQRSPTPLYARLSYPIMSSDGLIVSRIPRCGFSGPSTTHCKTVVLQSSPTGRASMCDMSFGHRDDRPQITINNVILNQ